MGFLLNAVENFGLCFQLCGQFSKCFLGSEPGLTGSKYGLFVFFFWIDSCPMFFKSLGGVSLCADSWDTRGHASQLAVWLVSCLSSSPSDLFLGIEWRSLVGCSPGCSPWDREELDMTVRLHFHFSLSCIGERHGNPLQCSCLENPMDRGAWWAAVYGVAESRKRLKRLSSSSSNIDF